MDHHLTRRIVVVPTYDERDTIELLAASLEHSGFDALVSRAGCLAARAALRLPVEDVTGGFRLWRADALRQIDAATTISTGFVFQVETTLRAHRAGLQVWEVPYRFQPRQAGSSNLSARISLEGVRVVLHLRHLDSLRATDGPR